MLETVALLACIIAFSVGVGFAVQLPRLAIPDTMRVVIDVLTAAVLLTAGVFVSAVKYGRAMRDGRQLEVDSASPHDRVRASMFGLLAAVVVVVMCGVWLQFRLSAATRQDTALVNVAGRQRMLSQRITRGVLSRASNQPDADLARHLGEMEAQAAYLVREVAAMRETGRTSMDNAANALAAGQAAREQLITRARAADADGASSERDVLADLRLSDQVLENAERVVTALQGASEHDADEATRSALRIASLILIALLIASVLIVEPAVRLIQRQHGAAAKRQRELEQLSAAAQLTGVAAMLTDQDGRISWVNNAFAHLTGFAVDEVIGAKPAALLHGGRTDDDVARTLDEHVRAGLGYSAEILECTREGRDVWVAIDVRPLRHIDGTVRGSVQFRTDVTARLAERQTLSCIFDTLSDGIIMLSAAGVVLKWNTAAERILGIRGDDFSGLFGTDPRWHCVDVDGVPVAHDAMPSIVALRTGACVRDLIQGFRRPDGGLRWLSISTEVVRALDGTIEAVVASFHDVTERLASAERSELVVAAASLGTWDLQVQSGAAVYNREFAQMLGFTLDEFPAHRSSWTSRLPPDERRSVFALFNEHLAGRTAEFRCELRLRRKDDSWAWVMCIGRITERSLDGAPLRAVGISMDISGTRELESRARTAQERLAVAIDGTSDGLWDWDVESGTLWVSPRCRALLGHVATDADSHLDFAEFRERMHPDDRGLVRDAMQAVLDSDAPCDIDVRMQQAEGAYCWFRMRCKARRDEAGRAIRIAGSIQDIGPQKEAAAMLQKVTESLEEAQALARMGSWSFDLLTGEIHWSRQTYALFGRDAENGPPDFETAMAAYVEADSARLQRAVDGAVHEGVPYELNLRIHDTGNGVRHMRASGQPRRGPDGSVVALLGTVSDITSEVEREAELQCARSELEIAMQSVVATNADLELASLHATELAARADAANHAKSEFLANMSHEIRTPLTAILGFTDVLRSELSTHASASGAQSAITTIQRAGQHLLTIINDILDLSKIEASKMHIEAVEMDLCGTLLEVDSLVSARAAEKGVQFRTSLLSAVPERIVSDPTRLRQILLNLTGNAAKFTERGAIDVRVSVAERADTAYLRIEIEDSGPGMTADQGAGLFAQFAQGDASVTRKYGGSGLGLIISRRLARLMDGDVSLLSSAPGAGSVFVVELPLVAAVGSERTTVLRERVPLTSDKDEIFGSEVAPLTGRVLLAEDGEDNRQLMTLFLAEASAHVSVAHNGRIALDMWRAGEGTAQAFDLIVTDMQMPEMDGYSLAEALRESGCSIPIIAVTAHAMAEDRQRCLDAGCSDYITKPIHRAEFVRMVRTWLASAPARGSTAPLVLRSTFADDASMAGLLEFFTSQLPRRIEALEAAAADRAALSSLAHQMKGAAGGYGYPSITDAAKVVEQLARDESSSTEALRSALDTLLERCTAGVAGAAT